MPKQPSPHAAQTLHMAPELPFFVCPPDLVFLSDDEGEQEVINVEDSDGGGDTHIYLSSDEEDDVVYADDGASYANSTAVSAAATSLGAASSHDYSDRSPNGGNSNEDAGGYFDDNDDDHHSGESGDDTTDFSSATASKSQRAPYNKWHPIDLCTLVEIDGQLVKDFEGARVPSSVLYEAFMEDPRPIRRAGLTSRNISYKRYQLRKKFRAFCKSDPTRYFRRRRTDQEGKFYACCRKAWPDIVEESRACPANK